MVRRPVGPHRVPEQTYGHRVWKRNPAVLQVDDDMITTSTIDKVSEARLHV